MKKIVILILTLISLMFGNIVSGKENKVNDRIFQYYCVDGFLFLETYVYGSKSTTNKFDQVYRQTRDITKALVPVYCNIKGDEFTIEFIK